MRDQKNMWKEYFFHRKARDALRVQNEQFSDEKGFILRYTEKEV